MRITMGRQTSQYSLCISVTQFTFYMINFVLFIWSTRVFIWSTFTFYMVKSTFYMVNFLLFIWSSRLFIWSTFYYLYRSVWNAACRLQTGGKTQTEDCRSGVKCRLGSWRINRLWLRYRADCEAQERTVECLEAFDTKHHSKVTLIFAAQNKGTRNRFLLSK